MEKFHGMEMQGYIQGGLYKGVWVMEKLIYIGNGIHEKISDPQSVFGSRGLYKGVWVFTA